MTARDTIAGAILTGHKTHRTVDQPAGRPPLLAVMQAAAVMDAIRGMPHDELAELRPDIAVEFYVLREQAAQRGHYLLTTLRAHHAEQENQP